MTKHLASHRLPRSTTAVEHLAFVASPDSLTVCAQNRVYAHKLSG
jgi:hypothetical protein